MKDAIEHGLEKIMFASRWLLAPFYLGLVLGIVLLLYAFGLEFMHLVTEVVSGKPNVVVIGILLLVDLTLLANLLDIGQPWMWGAFKEFCAWQRHRCWYTFRTFFTLTPAPIPLRQRQS